MNLIFGKFSVSSDDSQYPFNRFYKDFPNFSHPRAIGGIDLPFDVLQAEVTHYLFNAMFLFAFISFVRCKT